MISGYIKLNKNTFIYLDFIVLCMFLHSQGMSRLLQVAICVFLLPLYLELNLHVTNKHPDSQATGSSSVVRADSASNQKVGVNRDGNGMVSDLESVESRCSSDAA